MKLYLLLRIAQDYAVGNKNFDWQFAMPREGEVLDFLTDSSGNSFKVLSVHYRVALGYVLVDCVVDGYDHLTPEEAKAIRDYLVENGFEDDE